MTPIRSEQLSTVRFEVPGLPRPQGTVRAFVVNGKAVTTNRNKAQDEYRAKVGWHAQQAGCPLFEGPVSVTVVFWFPRPKSHYRGKSDQLKPEAPRFHTTRPDVDKTLRACLDGLTGVAFADDSQVAHVDTSKLYGEPCTALTIRRLA